MRALVTTVWTGTGVGEANAARPAFPAGVRSWVDVTGTPGNHIPPLIPACTYLVECTPAALNTLINSAAHVVVIRRQDDDSNGDDDQTPDASERGIMRTRLQAMGYSLADVQALIAAGMTRRQILVALVQRQRAARRT